MSGTLSSSPVVKAPQLPSQRWQVATAEPEIVGQLVGATGLSPALAQVLLNRGITTPDAAALFLNPETEVLPLPAHEFADLTVALELLENAIATQQPIAICGDYDADGMTSTALLMRALKFLGAQVDYAIPSRMNEGYGINQRIIEEFYAEGIRLVLTVDNGIAAVAPIARARELGMAVIITDHHDVPPELPPANAILNPKLIREDSPYRCMAGVGVAYVLAICLAQRLRKTQALTAPLIELFTLGTIADLAPLTGVNRRWVRRGLSLLPNSKLVGVQALIQVAGLSSDRELKPEAIGFRIGPRINAIGRIADPQLVIELLTTDDEGLALELAMKCEQVNQLRQQLCSLIEQEAIAWCEETGFDVLAERVLVIVQPEWHHGVIGIVASRLVERYGVPVFIGTYESDGHIRGSARGIPEFNVFEALHYCHDLLGKFGGHRAAGGFSMPAANLEDLRSRLQSFAHACLEPRYLKPLVKVDVETSFANLSFDLYDEMEKLQPCGIENPDPVFWTANVRVVEQKAIGRDQTHLKVLLADDEPGGAEFRAIAWRWGEYRPLPSRIDVAYRLRVNEWNNDQNLELEIVGARLPGGAELPIAPSPKKHAPLRIETTKRLRIDQPVEAPPETAQSSEPLPRLDRIDFFFSKRRYTCAVSKMGLQAELRITNADGQVLTVQPHQQQGVLSQPNTASEVVDLTQPYYFNLVRAALNTLDSAQKSTLLHQTQQILHDKDLQISLLQQQVQLLRSAQEHMPPDQHEQLNTLSASLQTNEATLRSHEAQIAQYQAEFSQITKTVDPAEIKRRLRLKVGEAKWALLDPRTQKDLYFACKHRDLIRADVFTAMVADYSEAALRLGLAAEREISQPFFHAFQLYLGEQDEVWDGDMTLSAMPPILTPQWNAFEANALQQPVQPAKLELYAPVLGDRASSLDPQLITQFLQQWQHPLAAWLLADKTSAASAIAQISQLYSLTTPLYSWQYDHLEEQVIDVICVQI